MRPARAIASLLALGLMMAFFHRVTAGSPLEARATLSFGFLLLTAYLGGALARRARLPRLTGYLLIGFAVGPAWLGLIRREEVDALQFIADAAVALIALAAGSELALDALRQGRVALSRLTIGAIVFPFTVVTLVMLSVTPWLPVTRHQPFHDAVVVALVLGTVAAAASPVLTLAMTSELDARGPLARALLAITVGQDLVVLVLFAVVLGVGRALASAGGLNGAVAGAALLHLGGSAAAGALLGYALGRYCVLAGRDTTLLLVATAFGTAAVARLAGLDTLIMALAAGFYIRNFASVATEQPRTELALAHLVGQRVIRQPRLLLQLDTAPTRVAQSPDEHGREQCGIHRVAHRVGHRQVQRVALERKVERVTADFPRRLQPGRERELARLAGEGARQQPMLDFRRKRQRNRALTPLEQVRVAAVRDHNVSEEVAGERDVR